MTKSEQEQVMKDDDEISLKEFILKLKRWYFFLLSKWVIILIAGLIGGVAGIVNAWVKKPTYKAELSFAMQSNEKSIGGLGVLASSFGLDVGGASAGGEFTGDNLLALMKSRSMVEKALLTTVNVKGKTETLVEFYLDFTKTRNGWKGKPELRNLYFLPNSDRSKFTLKQDSVLGALQNSLVKSNLTVIKKDKNSSITTLVVESPNELFSKYFTEILAKVVSDFYIQTKTEKEVKNVAVLQKQTDSVRRMLNAAISGVATSTDANPSPNPLLFSLRVPSQRKQIDVQANTAILTELVRNLEVAKMSLLQETPLIQVIDRPILPLEKDGASRSRSGIIGGIVLGFLTSIWLILKKVLADILK